MKITPADVKLLAALARDHPGVPAIRDLYERAYRDLELDQALALTADGQQHGPDDPLLFDLTARQLALIHRVSERTIRRWRAARRDR